MKKQVFVALAAVLAVGAFGSACKQMPGMVNGASKDLGVPVFLWALDNDTCAQRQLKQLFDEFGRQGVAGRSELTQKFRDTYKAIVVLATKDQGDTTGKLQVLELTDLRGHKLESKILSDTRDNPGHTPAGTVLDKGDASSVEGKVLSLRPNHSVDRSEKELYVTRDTSVFARMGKAEDDVEPLSLKDALDGYDMMLAPHGFAQADECGKLSAIADLF